MTTRLTGTAPLKMILQWDGTDEELIILAEELNGGELDSRDLGDAMGVLLTECAANAWELHIVTENGRILDCAYEFDSFNWERN